MPRKAVVTRIADGRVRRRGGRCAGQAAVLCRRWAPCRRRERRPSLRVRCRRGRGCLHARTVSRRQFECSSGGVCQCSHGSGYRHAPLAIAGADGSASPCKAADSVNISKAYRGRGHDGLRPSTGRRCGWRPGVHTFRRWLGQAGRALRTMFTRECDPRRSRAGRRRGQELALRRGVR